MITKLASCRLTIALLLLVFLAQQGNGVLVTSGGNAGSVTKELLLGTDTEYSSLTELGGNFIGDDWYLSGSDQNSLRNIANAGTNAQEVIVSNSGHANIQGSTAADSLSMGSTLSGQTIGETNIIVGSEAKNNQMIVSATGEEIGMDLKSASGRSASIIGSVSVDQEACLDEETSSYVSSGALGFSANGQRMTSEGNLKDFGLVAINHEKGVVENGGIITPGTGPYDNYNDPNSWVTLLFNTNYKYKGAIWAKRNVQLSFNSKGMPKTVTKEATKQAILRAANNWDDASSENLLADNIADSAKLAGKRDGANVHQFARLSGSTTVAMASLWFDTTKTVPSFDGNPYYAMLESDVRYNTALSWTNEISDQSLYHVTNIPYTEGKAITTGKKFLVESAALHETGHTLGLGDTYLDPIKKYDLSQIMTYYTDPQTELGLGDVSGIKALYG